MTSVAVAVGARSGIRLARARRPRARGPGVGAAGVVVTGGWKFYIRDFSHLCCKSCPHTDKQLVFTAIKPSVYDV